MAEYTLKQLRESYEISIEELSEYSNVSLENLKEMEKLDINRIPKELEANFFKIILSLERIKKLKSTKNYKEQLEKEIFEEARNYNSLFKKLTKKLIILTIAIIVVVISIIITVNLDKNLNKNQINIENENILSTFISLTQELKTLSLEIEKKENEKIEDEIKALEEKINQEKISLLNQEKDKIKEMLILMILSIIFLVLTLYSLLYNLKFRSIDNSIKTKEKIVEKFSVEALINELDKDFENNMIKINIYQLNAYNDQTKSQANKSFTIASITSVIGFILLCIGLILVFFGENTPGYLTTGVGLLIEFLSGVIFYLYNKTIIKMGEYHKKIVLTQNIALALKATDDFENEKKFEMKSKIIDELLKDINKYLSTN